MRDFEPVQSHHFTELNSKREQIELAFTGLIQDMRGKEAIERQLVQIQIQIQVSGTVEDSVQLAALQWRLKANLFGWNHYVCHAAACHGNCCESSVVYPLAALWRNINEDTRCRCGHPYAQHIVSFSGWEQSKKSITYDLREHLLSVAPEDRVAAAVEGIDGHIDVLFKDKDRLLQELEVQLVRYSNLGMHNGYLRLLRSQKAVLDEQLSTNPDSITVKDLLRMVSKYLKAFEETAQFQCCICFDMRADAVLDCGCGQFCHVCAARVGTCPLCRSHVTTRTTTGATTDGATGDAIVVTTGATTGAITVAVTVAAAGGTSSSSGLLWSAASARTNKCSCALHSCQLMSA